MLKFKKDTFENELYPEWEMSPTGRENKAGQIEVVVIGLFPEKDSGYQQTPEGQIAWVKKTSVENA